ncbi:hypothetical protein HOI18_04165 [Candidatus Uhrbacteria bacterium]|nr:hypothetical protein [Candidatus Uhrbacteria bacterium]
MAIMEHSGVDVITLIRTLTDTPLDDQPVVDIFTESGDTFRRMRIVGSQCFISECGTRALVYATKHDKSSHTREFRFIAKGAPPMWKGTPTIQRIAMSR